MDQKPMPACDVRLLREIVACHDKSGGAIILQKMMMPRMRALESKGLIEIHLLGNGKTCARITEAGRKAAA